MLPTAAVLWRFSRPLFAAFFIRLIAESNAGNRLMLKLFSAFIRLIKLTSSQIISSDFLVLHDFCQTYFSNLKIHLLCNLYIIAKKFLFFHCYFVILYNCILPYLLLKYYQIITKSAVSRVDGYKILRFVCIFRAKNCLNSSGKVTVEIACFQFSTARFLSL